MKIKESNIKYNNVTLKVINNQKKTRKLITLKVLKIQLKNKPTNIFILIY
jgi:hypothetical protein